MRLSPQVVLVGSGQYGMRSSHFMDCNVYLLDGGAQCVLIDAGAGLEPERIVARIEAAGIDMKRVTQLLLTHAHADHAAGAHFWRNKYGLKVVCPREAAPWVESGDREKTSLRRAIAAGAYPADFEFAPCPIDREVGEGDAIQVGAVSLQVLETPGHARGHVSYMMSENGAPSLFTGDVIFAGGTIVLQSTWDCDIQQYAATMARLHKMNIERLYAGHKAPILNEAHREVARAHEVFEGLGVPANFN